MELQGVASLALLPSGSVSGHFVHPESNTCLGIYGTEIPCERECSRSEDYRLIDLRILEYGRKKETSVIVECRGQDAARFHNVKDVHGWEESVVNAAKADEQSKTEVSFACTALKSDEAAEAHVQRYLPSLVNRGAVVNIGNMLIKGLDVELKKIHCEPDLSDTVTTTDDEIGDVSLDFSSQEYHPAEPISVTITTDIDDF